MASCECASGGGLCRLTFELSGWPRQDGLPVWRMMPAARYAGKTACRGQSALERGVRRRPPPAPTRCGSPDRYLYLAAVMNWLKVSHQMTTVLNFSTSTVPGT